MMRKQSNWERTLRRERLRDCFTGINFSKLRPPNDPEDEETDEEEDEQPDDEDETGTLPPLVEQTIAALKEANPVLTRQAAAHFLLHHRYGRQLLEDLSKQQKGTPPMDRADGLRDLAKQYGVARIAKMIVMENDAHGLSEHELTQLASEEFAKRALPGERPNTTFARLYEAPESLELRKAIAIARSTPADVTELQPQAKHAETVDADASAKAYAKLQDLGAALRAKDPSLTEAGAFTKAFTENPELARLAHRRPSATAGHEFPR